MPSINVGQMGHTTVSGGKPPLKSTPKITRINGDDYMPLVYRNMGNNHAYPFIWAKTLTFSGGGTMTLISGAKWHGMPAAEYSMVTTGAPAGLTVSVAKDTVLNQITVTSSAAGAVDVMMMVGYPNSDISTIACRGNTGAAQSLP